MDLVLNIRFSFLKDLVFRHFEDWFTPDVEQLPSRSKWPFTWNAARDAFLMIIQKLRLDRIGWEPCLKPMSKNTPLNLHLSESTTRKLMSNMHLEDRYQHKKEDIPFAKSKPYKKEYRRPTRKFIFRHRLTWSKLTMALSASPNRILVLNSHPTSSSTLSTSSTSSKLNFQIWQSQLQKHNSCKS